MDQTPITNAVDAMPISLKANIFRQINRDIPLSDYGIPQYIYRADIIPSNLENMESKHRLQMLNAATLNVAFDQGFPAVEVNADTGVSVPLWEKLPGESIDAFNAFMVYLELPEKSNHENPVRLLPMIASVVGKSIEEIVSYFHIYYWHFRSRAYDLFLVACHRIQREQRLMSIEGSHFKMAETLLTKINTIAEVKLDQTIGALSDPEGDTSDVKLKDLIDMVDKLVKVQRISVGLPAAGPQAGDVPVPHAPVSDTFRKIASDSQIREVKSNRSAEMDRILANPDDLAQMQDLVIRIGFGREMAKPNGTYEYDPNKSVDLEIESTDES